MTKSRDVPKADIEQFERDHPQVAEWDEPPTHGTPEYSCETDCVKRIVTGPLADAIRAKLGADPSAEVTVTERQHVYGWSTLTQENDFDCLIECAGVSKRLYEHWRQWNSLPSIIEWLTEPEAPPKVEPEPIEVPAAYQFPRRVMWDPSQVD